ncbi:hypothetical protein CLU83_0544 [Flavobacterium sp. 1]|uniref:hypothetical protein n=1 Tax=Flavobacterium sp. 1 TaxID=2035200 RepID=UPI000C24B959|nr:hypothetical protein [Flavobacterium sp. 1]PJJ07377.1 hypothetical protein CLU83_0544 [Flavobacterium sp. 1]
MKTVLIQEEPFDGSASTELALGCFTIGTLFFILFLTLTDNSFILIIGFVFIVLAALLNIIMLANLLHHFYILPKQRKYIVLRISILLSNIPVAFLYYIIADSFKLL